MWRRVLLAQRAVTAYYGVMPPVDSVQALELMRLACVNIGAHWQEHLEFWEGDDPGDYNITSVFAEYLVDMYERGQTDDFAAIFSLIEQMIVDGTDESRSLIVVGVLESIRNISSHKRFGEKVFTTWMKPNTLQAWTEVARRWVGKSSLVDVIRAERGR